MATVLRSFRKLHVHEVMLHDIAARLEDQLNHHVVARCRASENQRQKAKIGGIDGRRTSELSKPASAIKWPQANSKRQTGEVLSVPSQ
jgi:hypothetical protein